MSYRMSLERGHWTLRTGLIVALALAGIFSTLAFGTGSAAAFEDEYVKARTGAGVPNSMESVRYLAIKDDGTLLLADQGNSTNPSFARIRVLDSELEGTSSLPMGYGTAANQIRSASGVAVDAAGNIYVRQAHQATVAVKKFDPTGTTLLDSIGTNINSGTNPGPGEIRSGGAGGFDDIALDAQGNLYVVDWILNLITKFNANGDYVTRFGGEGTGDGQFTDLVGIAVSPDGNVHAIDRIFGYEEGAYIRDTRIQEFTPTGTYVGSWGNGSEDRMAELAESWDLTFDDNGMAYVTDTFAYVGPGESPIDVVKVFNADKEMVYRFGTYAEEAGPTDAGWDTPGSIVLDDEGGVYVADQRNARVVKWQLNASTPAITGSSPASPSSSTTVSITGTADPGATVEFFDNEECTGEPVGSGDAADFVEGGIDVTVEEDSTVTLWAMATSSNGGPSGCSEESVTFENQSTIPAAPVLDGSVPASPANNNKPMIKGTAEAGSTVELYANDTCSGNPVATGTAAAFAAGGLQVTVADNSTTVFRGKAKNAAGSSVCSGSSVSYQEVTPATTCPAGKTGTPPNCADPVGTAKIRVGKVKAGKVKAGKRISLKVPVSNTGNAAATGVKVCAKVNPKKMRKAVKAPKCVNLGSIEAGAQKVAKLNVKATKKAKGKANVQVTVTSGNAGKGSAKTRVTVTKAKKKKR